MKEKTKTQFYLGHIVIAWGGILWQIVHIYGHKSAIDLTMVWVIALVLKEMFAVPLSTSSPYKVWGWHHSVSLFLVIVLLIGVIVYG